MKNSDRLQDYSTIGLGLERAAVKLVPNQPRWKRAFSQEAHLLFDTLRLEDLRLYHCGSTSIPGICAKPILDIVGSASSLENLDARDSLLKKIGYE